MPRLFWGEYEPRDRELSVGVARVAFLNAVRLHIPEVLKQLSEQPFERYNNLGAPHLEWWQVKHHYRNISLRRSLFEWSVVWHLEEEWCLEHALTTMWHWHHYQPDLENLIWQQGGGSWMVPTNESERRFMFEHPGWEPTYDYRKTIKQEILMAFNQHLDEYLDRMESLVEERGYVKSKRKNEREHFEWLACFQVKGMSYAEIKDKFKSQTNSKEKTYLSDDTKAIRKAINDLAKYIGLQLREDGTAPGRRPSKTRSR
jgi:hypothetical protein